MISATPLVASLAAALFGVVLLVCERGTVPGAALRERLGDVHGQVRYFCGAVLLIAIGAASTAWLLPDALGQSPAGRGLAALVGLMIAGIAGSLWLRRQPAKIQARPARWLVLVSLAICLALLAAQPLGWLLTGFGLTLALAVLLPAFVELARSLDHADVPAMMRPLPARVLAAAVLSLALAGCLAWP